MGLLQRLIEAVRGSRSDSSQSPRGSAAAHASRFAEAFPYLTGAAYDESDPTELRGAFRALGGWKRDFPQQFYKKMLNVALWLWATNPIARRGIEYLVDYALGEGVEVKAEDKRVAEWIEEFWHDPINDIPQRQFQFVTELAVCGNLIIPVTVDEQTGKVTLGIADPRALSGFESGNGTVSKIKLGYDKEFEVIRFDTDPKSKTYGQLVGEAFFFTINRLAMMSHGVSELLHIADWADLHDQILMAGAESYLLQAAFIWDITIEGASQKEIDEFARNIPTPKPGSNMVHNERVKWQAVSPAIRAENFAEAARVLKNFILAGLGLPEHWFGEANTVNKASAIAMGEPAFKRLRSFQRKVKRMFELIVRFVVDAGIRAGSLPSSVSRKVEIVLPQLAEEHVEGIAARLPQIANALAFAREEGWITDDEAKTAFRTVAARLGYEFPIGVREDAGKAD